MDTLNRGFNFVLLIKKTTLFIRKIQSAGAIKVRIKVLSTLSVIRKCITNIG